MHLLPKFCVSVVLTLALAVAAYADEITPREAINHIGKRASVVGVVSQVSNSGKGTTFINFGGRYPNHIFYVVIFKKNAHKFPRVYGYKGQTLAISGKIELYRGKPQIIVSSPDQVQVR
ncbi:nucleotide-binding protein [Ruegeria meonggei]|uniref:DNA-binding protein n=1 Tax=Ruegeria meonggei TaxID=1446476 RepID=A0A1X6Z1S8_9RHOB|nr:nucleotide-binding protein [Ruegeria meonggei]SLN37657.1 hypothetical protein RUM8411_01637 [Ruegeria meonggei]